MTTESIEPRIDFRKVAPEAIRALAAVERYARLACEHFEERELVDLTMDVIAINSWNRLAISFRALAGTYEPAKEHPAG